MLDYSEQEIKEFLRKLVDGPVEIRPIGNHHLNRHLVFHVTNDCQLSVVFKLFYKRNRWSGEVATFNALQESSVKAPTLLEAGILDDGTEWILVEYLPGATFEEAKEHISFRDQRKIMVQMGEELAKVHALDSFDFFGPWDQDGNPIRPWGDFKSRFVWNAQVLMDQIREQHLQEEPLISRAYAEMQNYYDLLDDVTEASLCCADYGPRNVIVNQGAGGWELVGLIDFEHASPWDPDRDLANLFTTLFWEDQRMEPDFLEGYQRYRPLGKNFYAKRRLYVMNIGLGICSWAKDEAPGFYQKGVRLLTGE